ncbi:MAG: membrane protein [Epsilonproteobacteria bacterium (ex Lamellibrachia satsuma)]|nr:MAG: membrane protein [Epsilonproteobacteria bacterium (ex Lamellibrachia satsuma)]
MTYLTLFFVAFGAATFLPLGSEALFLYDLDQRYNFFLLWTFASIGNTLGSMINYWLGLKGEEYLERKEYLTAQKMEKAKRFFNRAGGFALLLSWAPVIGDPLTFIAGILQYNFKWFVFIVFIAKASRYAVIGFILQNSFS